MGSDDLMTVSIQLPEVDGRLGSKSYRWRVKLNDLKTASGDASDQALQYSPGDITTAHLHSIARGLGIKVMVRRLPDGKMACWRIQ